MDNILNILFSSECLFVTNKECKKVNYDRQQSRLITTEIEVGLQLPNANNPKELVRFVPRYVEIQTRKPIQ